MMLCRSGRAKRGAGGGRTDRGHANLALAHSRGDSRLCRCRIRLRRTGDQLRRLRRRRLRCVAHTSGGFATRRRHVRNESVVDWKASPPMARCNAGVMPGAPPKRSSNRFCLAALSRALAAIAVASRPTAESSS